MDKETSFNFSLSCPWKVYFVALKESHTFFASTFSPLDTEISLIYPDSQRFLQIKNILFIQFFFKLHDMPTLRIESYDIDVLQGLLIHILRWEVNYLHCKHHLALSLVAANFHF